MISCYHYFFILYAYLFILGTKNTVIVCNEYYVKYYDIPVTKISHNLFLVSFQTYGMRFATFFTARRHGTATTNPWVDQCEVCSALKLDTFTLATVTFEWLGRFQKTKISMKAV